MKNPGKIGNKVKRTEVYAKYKQQKKRLKKKLREDKVKEAEALGDKAPPKQVLYLCFHSLSISNILARSPEQSKILELLIPVS